MALPAFGISHLAGPIRSHEWLVIPAATDIASHRRALALLGSRADRAQIAAGTTIAIMDDVGAVIIIAFWHERNQLARAWFRRQYLP